MKETNPIITEFRKLVSSMLMHKCYADEIEQFWLTKLAEARDEGYECGLSFNKSQSELIGMNKTEELGISK